jgi:hypothetical protein
MGWQKLSAFFVGIVPANQPEADKNVCRRLMGKWKMEKMGGT